MLPGLRFLFAAIVLATSLLVFGLGAASLFRAAHEEFASIPARRDPPEPQFAQPSEAPPVLAMMRVEPPAAVTPEAPAPSIPAASEPAAPADAQPAVQPDKMAAATPDDPPAPALAPEPETLSLETPPPALAPEAVPAAADATPVPQPAPAANATTPAAAEPLVTAAADASASIAVPAPAPPLPAPELVETARPPSPETVAAEARIATLGGPEVVVAQPAAPKLAETKKPERSTATKPARPKERRRVVRTRPARQAAVQQQVLDAFGQPTLVPLTRR